MSSPLRWLTEAEVCQFSSEEILRPPVYYNAIMHDYDLCHVANL